jgi:hypothetical protein
VKFVDLLVERVGVVALQRDITVNPPARVSVGVVVGEAQRAAGAEQRAQEQNENDSGFRLTRSSPP